MTTAPPGFRGTLHTDPVRRALASEGAGPFRIMPQAVARPLDRDDVALLMAWATDTGTLLTPRGAGSGMPGGNIGPGVIVDLGALDRPLRVALSRTATVGAAVRWSLLNDTAGHFGFRLPPDPSSGAFCTLGGMVATNAAGARSLRHGPMRRWVRAVELVTTDGEILWLSRADAEPAKPATERLLGDGARVLERFRAAEPGLRALADVVARRFPQTSKNTAGYALDHWLDSGDLVDLVIGSEGTLGIVTRVELSLDLLPEATATVLVDLASVDHLGEVVGAIKTLDAVAIELLPLLPGQDGPSRLLIEFEGTPDTVRDRSDAVAEVPGIAGVRRALSQGEQATMWRERHGTSTALARLGGQARSLQIVEDGCVPATRLTEYLRGLLRAAKDAGVDIVVFGHAGDGHLHVNALADLDRSGTADRLLALRTAVHGLVLSLGGTPSGEHGDGRLRADALEALYGTEILDGFRQLKAAFDPAGVLNPGVIVPAGPLPPFKAGPSAPPVPPEVAARLLQRERNATWGTEENP